MGLRLQSNNDERISNHYVAKDRFLYAHCLVGISDMSWSRVDGVEVSLVVLTCWVPRRVDDVISWSVQRFFMQDSFSCTHSKTQAGCACFQIVFELYLRNVSLRP
jgi:hypothetical protein